MARELHLNKHVTKEREGRERGRRRMRKNEPYGAGETSPWHCVLPFISAERSAASLAKAQRHCQDTGDLPGNINTCKVSIKQRRM